MTITKLTIPIMVFGPIFAAAIGAGGTFAATKAKLDENSAKTERLATEVEKLKEQREELTIKVTRLDTKLEQALGTLEKIDSKLDRMAR